MPGVAAVVCDGMVVLLAAPVVLIIVMSPPAEPTATEYNGSTAASPVAASGAGAGTAGAGASASGAAAPSTEGVAEARYDPASTYGLGLDIPRGGHVTLNFKQLTGTNVSLSVPAHATFGEIKRLLEVRFFWRRVFVGRRLRAACVAP